MNSKQMISLLLASQILSAPMAQAVSLSRPQDTRQGFPRMTLQSKTVATASVTPNVIVKPEPSAAATPAVTPTAEPSATPAVTPTAEPSATPAVTPTAEPSATPTVIPTVEPSATPAVTPTAEPSATPAVTPTAEPSAMPAVTPTAEPTAAPAVTPMAEPTATPAVTPTVEPSATPTVTPTAMPVVNELLQMPMLLAEEGQPATRNLPFNTPYIGFGYDVYRADRPERDNSVKTEVGKYFSGNAEHYANFAVEKPLDASDEILSTAVYAYAFWLNQDKYTDIVTPKGREYLENNPGAYDYQKGWYPREDGNYYLEDMIFHVCTNTHGSVWQDDFFTLEDVVNDWLGRLPDYEFDAWYVSAFGFDVENYFISSWHNNYSNNIQVTYGDNYVVLPILKSPWPVQDYRLNSVITADEMELIRDQIVLSYENVNNITDNRPKENYYRGTDPDNWFTPEYADIELPLIAYWKLSSDATLVNSVLLNREDVQYTGEGEDRKDNRETVTTQFNPVCGGKIDTEKNLLSNLYDKPFADSSTNPVNFDPAFVGSETEKTYYLRVPGDVEGISPTLLAAEAFKTEEEGEGLTPGVAIRARKAGEENYTDYTCDKEILNDSRTESDGTVKLYNNALCPMRSKWTVGSAESEEITPTQDVDTPVSGVIELDRANLAAGDNVKGLYNEIEVTVTAPDGKTQKTYRFFIERLNDPVVEQKPGNTPYGMIARDTVLADKDEAKTLFVSGDPTKGWKTYSFNGARTFEGGLVNNELIPGDHIENNGGIYEKNAVYHPSAWVGENLDLDENAIVVYQDSSFVDPGFTVYDGEGREVDLTSGDVERSLILRTSASGLLYSDLADDYGDKQYYTDKVYGAPDRMAAATASDETTLWNEAFQTVKDADGKDRIDLRGLNIVPGVYTMEYRFTDPLYETTDAACSRIFDSKTTDKFTSDEAAANAATFTRDLVVLPLPGDVNMDGLVTVADAEALRRLLNEKKSGSGILSATNSKAVSLYTYRVCDVNNDGTVSDADVNMLLQGYVPHATRNDEFDKCFYLPLTSGMDPTEEETWHKQNFWDPATTNAESGKGSLSLEYLGVHNDGITTPAALDALKNTETDGTVHKLKKDEIFWVGVKVDLSGLTDAVIKQGISAIDLSILYDQRYLEPVTLSTEGVDVDSQWRKTVADYNIDATGTSGSNLWPSGWEVAVDGTFKWKDYRPYPEHYSRSVPGGLNIEKENMAALKVTLRDSNLTFVDSRNLGDGGYLLRLPFKLKAVPDNATNLEALEMILSASDFGIHTESGAGVWSSQTEPVFGGVSKNLMNELTYIGGLARKIPLADQSLASRTELKNQVEGSEGKAVYGEPYKFTDTVNISNQSDDIKQENLQPWGLTYDSGTGTISGIPQKTGTLMFSVTNNQSETTPYYIQVGKAPLTLYAVPQERYYGEPNAELDFKYDTNCIKAPDLVAGSNYVSGFVNDGTSTQLKTLAGYQKPNMTTAVTQGTDVGTYDIAIANGENSGLSNYYFVYADVSLDQSGNAAVATETADEGTSPLVVKKRPLRIESITETGMKAVAVRVDTVQIRFEAVTASYQKDQDNGFTPKDLTSDYSGKLTGDPIYGEDKVDISFTAQLSRENDVPPYYDIPDGQNSKPINAAISAIRLGTADKSGNYELVGPHVNKAQTTVSANILQSVEMSNWDKYTGYYSGDQLSLYGMTFKVTYDNNTTDSVPHMGDDSALNAKFGQIYLTWVTETEKNNKESHHDDADRRLKNYQEMRASTHDGNYLCVTVVGGGKTVSWFSEKPFEVGKRRLTLTAKPVTVYYGEYQSTMLDYTYDPTNLSKTDYDTLKAKLSHEPTGASSELTTIGVDGLAGFVAPVLSAWPGNKGEGTAVSADTPVQWSGDTVVPSKIYIENKKDEHGAVLSGAKDYSFAFTGEPGKESEYGKSDLTILPRPIMVQSVTLGTDSDVFLYDDTANLRLKEMYHKEDGNMVAKPVTLTGVNSSSASQADTFVAFRQFQQDSDTNEYYYYKSGANNVTFQLQAPAPVGDPIHTKQDNTLDEVVATYVATYKPDVANAYPPENPYFQMNGQSEKTADVTISGLLLPRDLGDNGNYELVFQRQLQSKDAKPVDETATGRVKLRPIQSMKVSADALKTTYIYGETLKLDGMTLTVTYDSEGDNDLPTNQAKHVVERPLKYTEGGASDSYADQGLELYWLMDETLQVEGELTPEKLQEYLTNKKLLPTDVNNLGRYPDVEKTGKTLVVCGRRFSGDGTYAAHPLVWAKGSAAFTIDRKPIYLTVEGSNRYYGEANKTYGAYYAFADLALPDQKALTDASISADSNGRLHVTAGWDGSASSSTAEKSMSITSGGSNTSLDVLNGAAPASGTANLGVRFTTSGVQGSSVGTYSIGLEKTSGDNMKNYVFEPGTPGKLRVFRRPIVVDEILEKPISTIFHNTAEIEFPAAVTQTGQAITTGKGFRAALPVTSGSNFDNSAKDPDIQAAVNAGMSAAMPLSGNAICGSDEVGLAMTVVFPAVGGRSPFDAGKYQTDQLVTIKDLALTGDAEKNYFLVYKNSNDEYNKQPATPTATGQLDKRPITAIKVTQVPKMEYTYGESLDLSGLGLTVTYGRLELENNVEIAGSDEYLSYSQMGGRLSVNYWDPADPVPTDQAHYGDGTMKRPAKSGDHLTIAPAHDIYTGEDGTFAHNGKYLILTARTDNTVGYSAAPILVNDGGTPIPITVKPLDLTYTLEAQDKTYHEDGFANPTAAAGSITLTNAYTTTKNETTGVVNDRDLIYVVTGETYSDLSAYLNDAAKDKTAAYTFSVDGSNQTDRLAFNFYDENVMYYEGDHTSNTPVDPEGWKAYWDSISHTPKAPSDGNWDEFGAVAPMPVLVSGIKLAGPDAANYTLDGFVGKKNDVAAVFDAATANTAKDQVPYATINKAEQVITSAERPQLTVDAHSNAVKLTYDTDRGEFSAIKNGRTDQYGSELHYEYGLQTRTEDPASMAQWGDWSDTVYFGGERMHVSNDENYDPAEPPKEPGKDDVVKGQDYPWAAEDPAFGVREPLDRDTVYWGMVRLAETHNYQASEPVYAYTDDTEAASQSETAKTQAEELSEQVLNWAVEKPKEDDPDPVLSGPAVKTYLQSFKIVSSEEKPGTDGKRYSISTLEAVWFTDIQNYKKAEELSAVLRNLAKTRFYGFYWDRDKSARLEFNNEDGLDLSQKPLMVEINEKQEDGSTERKEVEVNIGDDPSATKANSAVIYVSTSSEGGGGVTIPEKIEILGGVGGGSGEGASGNGSGLVFELGSAPVKLEVKIKPSFAVLEGLIWESSDPRIIQIGPKGELIFAGVGKAEITVTTRFSRRSASVTVTVTDPTGLSQGIGDGWETSLALAQREENRFNFYYTDPLFALDDEYAFHPEWEMTRAELVSVLAQLYQKPKKWKWDGKFRFSDISEKDTYAETVELLHREGILKGLPDGTFGGEHTATRAEVAAILCRMMGLEPLEREEDEHFFLDYGVDNGWADGYIDALAEAGVVKGTGDHYFSPNRAITRAELAAMLGRLLLTGVHYGEKLIVPTDVEPEHWAYAVILRAVNTVVPNKKS